MDNVILIALALTTFAGLSTTVGSLLGLVVKKPGPRFMSLTLGFSAGAMILISFVELLNTGIDSIGFFKAHVAFFLGIIGMFLVDALIPHEYIGQVDRKKGGMGGQEDRLLKTGIFVALGIGIHNFPEGMATFAGTLEDVGVGIAIAIAIAIHNIPEGLAISVPIYAATGSRKKAFWWSFLSGVTEPVGAGIAAIFLMPFLTPAVLGWVLAIVGGIMLYISFDELIPLSRSYGEEHFPILGLIIGMVVMALTLWLFI
jgi:ZIP family zinc transporter